MGQAYSASVAPGCGLHFGGLGKEHRAFGNNCPVSGPIVGRSHHRSRTLIKITLVTGASRGLGLNTALSIARRGGDVVLTYQNRARDAQTAVDDIQAMGR